MNAIALAVHLLSAVVWVGGMFFAYVVLRPSLLTVEPPVRLSLWAGAFRRFFPWVWVSVLLLPSSGYFLIFNVYRSMAATPVFVHIMTLLAYLMFALFIFLYYGPYRRFNNAIQAQQWEAAAASLNRIRQIVLSNLLLGVCVVLLGGAGRYLSVV